MNVGNIIKMTDLESKMSANFEDLDEFEIDDLENSLILEDNKSKFSSLFSSMKNSFTNFCKDLIPQSQFTIYKFIDSRKEDYKVHFKTTDKTSHKYLAKLIYTLENGISKKNLNDLTNFINSRLQSTKSDEVIDLITKFVSKANQNDYFESYSTSQDIHIFSLNEKQTLFSTLNRYVIFNDDVKKVEKKYEQLDNEEIIKLLETVNDLDHLLLFDKRKHFHKFIFEETLKDLSDLEKEFILNKGKFIIPEELSSDELTGMYFDFYLLSQKNSLFKNYENKKKFFVEINDNHNHSLRNTSNKKTLLMVNKQLNNFETYLNEKQSNCLEALSNFTIGIRDVNEKHSLQKKIIEHFATDVYKTMRALLKSKIIKEKYGKTYRCYSNVNLNTPLGKCPLKLIDGLTYFVEYENKLIPFSPDEISYSRTTKVRFNLEDVRQTKEIQLYNADLVDISSRTVSLNVHKKINEDRAKLKKELSDYKIQNEENRQINRAFISILNHDNSESINESKKETEFGLDTSTYNQSIRKLTSSSLITRSNLGAVQLFEDFLTQITTSKVSVVSHNELNISYNSEDQTHHYNQEPLKLDYDETRETSPDKNIIELN